MEITAKLRKGMIGAIIGVVLSLQFTASFGTFVGLHAQRKFWPWTNYPMYEQKYVANDPIDVTGLIYIVLESGDRVQFTADMLNIGFWRFNYLYNRLSKLDEPRPEDIELILNASTAESDIVAIETYHYPLAIRKDGPAVVAEKFRRRVDL